MGKYSVKKLCSVLLLSFFLSSMGNHFVDESLGAAKAPVKAVLVDEGGQPQDPIEDSEDDFVLLPQNSITCANLSIATSMKSNLFLFPPVVLTHLPPPKFI
jgi:hypothetical protein